MLSDPRLDAAFDTIRDRLLSFGGDRGAEEGALVVSIMSRVRGEGVTTVAVGLARGGPVRTLLVDYDPTPSGAAATLGLRARVFPGFSAAGSAPSLADYVQPASAGPLSLLTLDRAVPSGLEDRGPWAESFECLRAAYPMVLVDAGSTHTTLPLRWARLATRRILVVDTSRTTEEELERLKAELGSVQQRVDGVILNKRTYYVPSSFYDNVK